MFETSMTVPTAHLRELIRRLTVAGFTVLDTGERVATDHGPEAEASLRLLHVTPDEAAWGAMPLGVSP